VQIELFQITYLTRLRKQIVGVDGVRKAAEEFIQDNQLTSDPPSSSSGMEILDLHRRGRAGHPIRFVVGDFFKMPPDVAGTFEVAPSPFAAADRLAAGRSVPFLSKPQPARTAP
jgi:hypothetical protein